MMGGTNDLLLAPLGEDATLGASVNLGTAAGGPFYNTQLVATPSGLLALSLASGTTGALLYVARASSAGASSAPAVPVTGLGEGVDGYAVTASSSRVGLLWSQSTSSNFELRFAELDWDGAPVGPSKLLAASSDRFEVGAVTATAEGYLFAYVTQGLEAALVVGTLDTAGQAGEPVTLRKSSSGLHSACALLARGSEVLLAWSDTGGTWDNSDLSRTVRLSRLGLDGQRVAQDVYVHAPVTNEENVAPSLTAQGEDVALVWSQGSVIYMCAGCMPDNRLQFVMLDGATLAPASAVLTLTNPAAQGGLVYPATAWRDDALTVAAAVGYHVSGEGAAGTITCTAP
jgi:hypothetical protein